jgi:hypothetical protein
LRHGFLAPDYGRTEFYADLLADNAEILGEPYSRHVGKVRELRFHLQRQPVRITYWLERNADLGQPNGRGSVRI